jgi:hypothetical protein
MMAMLWVELDALPNTISVQQVTDRVGLKCRQRVLIEGCSKNY